MAKSFLDKVGIDADMVFFLVLFAGLPLLIFTGSMISGYMEQNHQARMAEIEAAKPAQQAEWIGINEVKAIGDKSLTMSYDSEKGVHMLFAVADGVSTLYYIKSTDVEAVDEYVASRQER
jgi:hypothetical protein